MTDNELIAEFMGLKPYEDGRYGTMWPDPTRCNYVGFGLKYHLSFDWLMPVVDAIEELEEPHPSNNPEKGTVWPYQFEILSRTTVQIVDNRNDNSIVLINQDGLTRIESVYKAVVEFIKFYNDKNKTE